MITKQEWYFVSFIAFIITFGFSYNMTKSCMKEEVIQYE